MMEANKHRMPFFAAVFGLLCVLTAMSFWVANSYLMEQPSLGWVVMLSIAVAKTLLVVLFFMHLWWERAWKYVLTIPAIILAAVLVLLLVPDVGYRFANYSQTRKSNAPEPIYNSSPLESVDEPTSCLEVPPFPARNA